MLDKLTVDIEVLEAHGGVVDAGGDGVGDVLAVEGEGDALLLQGGEGGCDGRHLLGGQYRLQEDLHARAPKGVNNNVHSNLILFTHSTPATVDIFLIHI